MKDDFDIIFIIIFLLKALVILIGLGLTFWILIKGLIKREADWKNKAMKYFFSTCLIVILLSVLDFGIDYINSH